MTFATNSDLIQYFGSAMEHGVGDWTAELSRAQADVEKLIKVRWFNLEFGGSRSRYAVTNFPQFSPSKLTPSQWTRATVYRALGWYILPKLSTFRPESDTHREQMNFYQNLFEEEMQLQTGWGVEYDLNNDGVIEQGERFNVDSLRLFR